MGNLKVFSESEGLKDVAKVFSKLVKTNKKIIKPNKEIPLDMFGWKWNKSLNVKDVGINGLPAENQINAQNARVMLGKKDTKPMKR